MHHTASRTHRPPQSSRACPSHRPTPRALSRRASFPMSGNRRILPLNTSQPSQATQLHGRKRLTSSIPSTRFPLSRFILIVTPCRTPYCIVYYRLAILILMIELWKEQSIKHIHSSVSCTSIPVAASPILNHRACSCLVVPRAN